MKKINVITTRVYFETLSNFFLLYSNLHISHDDLLPYLR